MIKYSLWVYKSFRLGHSLTGPPNANLGPPNISETIRARKLKLRSPLDIVKYSL